MRVRHVTDLKLFFIKSSLVHTYLLCPLQASGQQLIFASPLCSTTHVRHLPPHARECSCFAGWSCPRCRFVGHGVDAFRCPGQHMFWEPLFTHSKNVSLISLSMDPQHIDHTPLPASPSHFFFRNMHILFDIRYFLQGIAFKYSNFSFTLFQILSSFIDIK